MYIRRYILSTSLLTFSRIRFASLSTILCLRRASMWKAAWLEVAISAQALFRLLRLQLCPRKKGVARTRIHTVLVRRTCVSKAIPTEAFSPFPSTLRHLTATGLADKALLRAEVSAMAREQPERRHSEDTSMKLGRDLFSVQLEVSCCPRAVRRHERLVSSSRMAANS